MVRPSLRRKKQVKKKTPGGKHKTIYKKKRKSKHKCSICGAELAGVPADGKKASKSKRRPSRPYGGRLCSKCARKVIALKAKLKLKSISIDDVPVSLRKFVSG